MVENERMLINEPDRDANASLAGQEASRPRPGEARATEPRGKSEDHTLPEIVADQFRTLQLQHQAVLAVGSVEAIHKMRVATRRLQASLDLLQTKSDDLKTWRSKKRLRNWRRRLSTVRNCDVFLKLIELESSSRRSGHREQFATLVSILSKKREERIANVQEYLAGVSISKFAARLGITIPPLQPSAPVDGAAVEEEAAEQAGGESQTETSQADLRRWPEETRIVFRAADRIDQRLAEFQALAAQAHATTHPQELHQLRIAAKRLRYLLEIVSALGYGEASRALVSLRSIQDRIGDWHDLEALEEEIINTVSRRKFLKKHLTESAHMLLAAAHIEKKKNGLVKRIFPIKVAASVPATSQKLARALRRKAAALKAASEAPSQATGEG
jgi:CHAD domain-containing protein